ncbi:MAG: leucine-rich repeat protein [Candidatus Lokiarchaeota archaeon]|nr:leucine-rich repeat protein [Candidatus Lokiarchaeota archaeon]
MDSITYRNKIYKVKRGKLILRNKGINDLSELEGLETLTDLKSLQLPKNNIREIKSLEHLKQLVTLDLSYNQIEEIKNLGRLVRLKTLNLNNNKINEIKGLNSLKNLKGLALNGNNIGEIKGLDNLTSLKVLHIRDNNISDVKELLNLRSLKYVDLGKKKGIPRKQIRKLVYKGISTRKKSSISRSPLRYLFYYIGSLIAVLIVDIIISLVIISRLNIAGSYFPLIFGLLLIPSIIIVIIVICSEF